MKYVYWAIPGRLAGRPGPDEFPWDLAELRQAGFRAILSLHEGGIEPGEMRAQGFVHQLLILPCSVPPEKQDVEQYRLLLPKALDFISAQLAADSPTLVHCHAGKDRTGVVLATYLCRVQGEAPAEAIARLRAARRSLLSAEGYEALAYELAKE